MSISFSWLLYQLLSNAPTDKGKISHRSYIFIDKYILPNYEFVCDDAKRSLTVENAGGKSDISEMFSIDYFSRVYDSSNVILEKEVNYWIDYKMVDFICTINNHRIGVSVARAMGYPNPNKFNKDMAKRLLYKKLSGLIIARNGVAKCQSFYKSILHIWCQDERIANLLLDEFSSLDENDYGIDVKGVLFLQLTICPDVQLYKNVLNL